jgi:hypothetical protein
MTRLAILLAGLMLAPDCAAQAPDDSGGQFRIRNLATGPVCREADLVDERRAKGQPPSDRICQGNDVPIQGKDGCIWSGEHKRCTWYGFEFDYVNAEGLPTGTAEVALEGKSGHYFSPGYDLYQAVTFPWGIVRLGYDCTYKGAPAFQANFRLIYSSAFR